MRRGNRGLAGLALLAALALVIAVAAGPAIAKKITGSKGNERIVGTKKSDRINGKGGTDQIKGKGGNDKLRGGKGDDLIVGGKGVDRHLGGPGNDVLKAADGRVDAVIDGGSGTNRCIVDTVELSIVRNCGSVQSSPPDSGQSPPGSGQSPPGSGQSPAAALVRATLTWDATEGGSNIDLDLWVFDSSGNKARAAANTIPNTSFSPNDVDNPGNETFTDLAYTNPGARNFSFGVCYQDGGSQHVRYNLDYVTADGVHHTASEEYGSDGAFSTFSGGAPIPSAFCKAP